MKKKKAGDLMQDPFYSRIVFRIETLLHDQDLAAQAESLRVTDTNAKSALHKALLLVQGKPEKDCGESLKDQWIGETAKGLVMLYKALQEEGQIEPAHFCRALKVVVDSLKLRREMYGHARGYLDFLKSFIEDQKIV